MVELGALGLGGTELLILIIAAAMLFLGGKKIPELAKGLGRAMGEFQRGRMEVERELGLGKAAAPAGENGGKPEAGAALLGAGAVRESKVVLAARALGIETGGKTEEELKKEIAALVGDQPKNDAIK